MELEQVGKSDGVGAVLDQHERPHRVDHRLQDPLGDVGREVGRRPRQGRIGPHAPGVGAGVPLANAFVVLGRRQQHHGLPIGEGKHRDLRPVHPLFQHQGGAC